MYNHNLKAIAAVPGAQLDVVAVVSNPRRFLSRYRLYRSFEKHMLDSGVRLTTVELAQGDRAFEVSDGDPRVNYVKLRTRHEFWAKEALINIGVSRLPSDWAYVAWIDADVLFARPDWAVETVHQLQHHPIVQLFSEAHDLGPDGHVFNTYRSFAWSNLHGIPRRRPVVATAPAATAAAAAPPPGQGRPGASQTATLTSPGGVVATTTLDWSGSDYYGGTGRPADGGPDRIAFFHHPGFAWACTRDAFDTMGGLIDFAVVGEADYIMAKALVGEAEDVIYPGVSYGYRRAILNWQAQALKLRGDLGVVDGTLLHNWHGRKADRRYWDRCRILQATKFSPDTDLKRDAQGLYQLVDHGDRRSMLLRDAIRSYFRSRSEDSIDM